MLQPLNPQATTREPVLQLKTPCAAMKILHAATKTWHTQINKLEINFSCILGRFFTTEPPGKPKMSGYYSISSMGSKPNYHQFIATRLSVIWLIETWCYPTCIKDFLKNQFLILFCLFFQEKEYWGFPSGSVVKNLPVNTGDLVSTPAPGRSHILHSN